MSLLAKVKAIPAMAMVAASEGAASSFDLGSVMQSSVDQVKGDAFMVLGIVVPAVVAVVGVVVGVKFGVGWLKKIKG